MKKMKARSSPTNKTTKATAYAIRKERKSRLVNKVKKMQKELDELKFRVLMEQGEIHQANARTQMENAMLHKFIQKQHVTLATTQAAIAAKPGYPAQNVICLGEDRVERRKMLLALRDHKIDYAARYLAARSNGLDLSSSYSHEECFHTTENDYCLVRFEINLSVAQVPRTC